MAGAFDHDMATRRLARELLQISRTPIEGCSAGPLGDSLLTWRAIISGPSESPYEQGVFEMLLVFPPSYPVRPPKVSFQTKIYHPNIAGGNVCLDLLRDDWDPSSTISKILSSVRHLLAYPDAEYPLDGPIAQVLRNHPDTFAATARDWAAKYAS